MSVERAKQLFEGKWKQIKSENQAAILKELGLNALMSKIASKSNPEITLVFEGDEITVTFKVPVNTATTKLKIGATVPIDNATGKGTIYTYIDGDELVTEQTSEGGKAKKMTIRRRIVDGNQVLVYEMREPTSPFDGPIVVQGTRTLAKV